MRRQYVYAVGGALVLALFVYLASGSPGTPSPLATITGLLASPEASTSSTTIATTTKQVQPAPVMPSGNVSNATAELRSALVNIICLSSNGNEISSISGSGVIVSSKGIILTNSHIAEYFLLANQGVSCTIRTGSPARNAYTASLIFISPQWLAANANILETSAPTGTGEHDLALLAITGSAASTTLPAAFPYVPLQENPPVVSEPVIIGSYAAQFLDPSEIVSALSPTLVYGSIKSLFTFTTSTVDVISLGGSAAAQEGSSGGGIVDASGELTGLITTSTTAGSTSSRNLAGITATYIRRDYQDETGQSFNTLLATPTSVSVAAETPSLPTLESIITANLH